MSKLSKRELATRMRILGMTFLGLFHDNRDNEVNMSEIGFEACGTIACHAGWFAISRNLSRSCIDRITVQTSGDDMAKYLGFSNRDELEIFMKLNPEIWGNKNGGGMFCHHEAFLTDLDSTPLTLEVIGEHWLKVADRIEVS